MSKENAKQNQRVEEVVSSSPEERPVLTEIVTILDRSGSMAGLESDTIGGYNGFLEEQRKLEGEAILTTVLFDNQYELLHDRVDIQEVTLLTKGDYFVRGSTALLDAIGYSIQKIVHAHRLLPDERKPKKTIFMIITDGHENASRDYRYDEIQRMIQKERDIYGWEFIFMGANIDAVAAARDIGIHPDRSVRYQADAYGTGMNFKAMNMINNMVRKSKKISPDWSDEIRAYQEQEEKDSDPQGTPGTKKPRK